MNKTILQVPMDRLLRNNAERVASTQGFSSLQELVRVLLNKVTTGNINLRLEETVRLSPEAAKQYDQIIDEIESGKVKMKGFVDVDSLMKSLNED